MSTLKNALVMDKVSSVAVELLREAHFDVLEEGKSLTTEALINLVNSRKIDTILVRSTTRITKPVLQECPSLKVVARAGVGVDNIDVEAAKMHGVLVINAPVGNTLSAAEHACALILSMARQIPRSLVLSCDQYSSKKQQVTKGTPSELITELSGKCLAVIGLGRIGQMVGQRMNAFNMKVIGYDPVWTKDHKLPPWLSQLYTSLDEVWPLADFVTLHLPLLDSTKHLINQRVFNKCKPGMKIVNCARGGIVDEAALLEALENGQCGMAALDVLELEPPKKDNFIEHPRCIITPHLGGSSVEAQERVAIEVASAICNFKAFPQLDADGTGLEGSVNLTQASRAFLEAVRGDTKQSYLLLDRLPQLAFQMCSLMLDKLSDNMGKLQVSVFYHKKDWNLAAFECLVGQFVLKSVRNALGLDTNEQTGQSSLQLLVKNSITSDDSISVAFKQWEELPEKFKSLETTEPTIAVTIKQANFVATGQMSQEGKLILNSPENCA